MTKPARSPNRSALARAIVDELKDDAARPFAIQIADDANPDELPELTTAALAANLADFWRFAERRRGRGPRLHITPAIGAALDRLEIVQDDAPFLVDSVMGEI